MKLQSLVLATAAALTMTSAFAVPAGTWTIGAGVGYVMPESNNGTVTAGGTLDTDGVDYSVDVDDDIRPTLTGEYFVADNVGIELLAAIPFHHDITLEDNDGNKVDAKTQHLPPTLSVQYHFDNYGLPMNVKPFVGVGLNYTNFFKEKIYLPEGNGDLEIDDSFGVAGHIGVDFPFSPTDAFRIDARYIDLQPDVELNGEDIGDVDINPWVFGVSYIKSF